MNGDAPVLTALTLTELVSVLGPGVSAVLGAVLLALGLLVGLALFRARRRTRREIRSVVQALEELRSGRGRGHAGIAPGSKLGLIADAVNRLGADLHHTWSEAEQAAERWRAVTDATRDMAIITTDTDGDIRSFSAGASALTGWDEGEVVSRPAAVLFEENAYKDLLPKLARRSLRTQGVTTRSTMVRRDGSTFQAEVIVRMLMGSSSQPVGFMMLVRDISEQIRTENELRDSERRYRGLIESLSEGVIIVKEGRIVYANPAAETLCGGTGASLLGSVLREHVATGDVLVVQSALESLTAGEGPGTELTCRLLGPDGLERTEVRIMVSAVEFGGGTAAMLLMQDETASRRIAEELRHNETRLDAVLEATSDGVLVLSEEPRPRVRMTNRAFAELFDLSLDRLLGASEEEVTELLRAAAPGGDAVAMRIEAPQEEDAHAVISFGEEGARQIRLGVTRLRGRAGQSLGRVVVCRDVTEQKRSEREFQEQAEKLQLGKVELEHSYRKLNEVNRQLESRTRELDQLNRELRRLDEMKSDLIGNVSHELQTPLVSIRGYTEMILKERLGPVSAEQRKGLNLSLRNIDRLIAMIDNLAAIAHTDPDLRETELSRFPLRPLVDEAVALLEEPIARKTLRVEVRIEDDGLVVHADRDKILQVYLNLLSNAVKFSHAGGKIEITARAESAGQLTSVVKDGGVGIPAESLGRIFERHYQVRPSSGDQPDGSGIGLSIVRDILRMHGCTIAVASEDGRGSEFTFSLPLAGEEETAPERASGPAAPVEHESRPAPPETARPGGESSAVSPAIETDDTERAAPVHEAEPATDTGEAERGAATDESPPAIEADDTEPAAATDEPEPEAETDDAEPTIDAPGPRPRLRIIRRYKSNG